MIRDDKLQSDKPNEQSDDSDDSLQTFSKTCSIMYGKISKKQYEYLQAMTVLQEVTRHIKYLNGNNTIINACGDKPYNL